MEHLERRVRRRDVVSGVGALAAVGLAGCIGDGGSTPESGQPATTEPDEPTTTEPERPTRPEPERQLPVPVAGDENASVTVTTFEDFACSHCRSYSLETLPEIRSEYVEPGDIRYERYDFPIPVDERHSWLAADAARSVQANADSIDAFWTFTERVFENQGSLSLDLYESLANDVGVDGSTVRRETENRTYEPTVVANKQTGIDRGVNGTPAIFVGDERLDSYSYETVSGAIDGALDEA